MKMHRPFKILFAALMLTAAPWIVTSTVAAPISPSPRLQSAAPTSIETAQYGYGWNGHYRRADRRAHRWERRAYRRGYGYDGYNAYAYVPGATASYYYSNQLFGVSNQRSCAIESAGREELCGYYGSLLRRAYY